jgi:4-carboxymuconolactone decarboxylase
MDQKTYEKGLEVRSAVLGKEYVENSLRTADAFNKPFQEMVTEWRGVGARGTAPQDAQHAQHRDDQHPEPAA